MTRIEKVRLWFLRLSWKTLQTLTEVLGSVTITAHMLLACVYIVIVRNIIGQANSNPAVNSVLFVLILLLNTSWGQFAVLTLSTIITPTWTESWGLMNQREGELSVQPSRDQHIVLLLSCERRDRSCATGLSFAPHIFQPQPLPPLSTPHLPLFYSASLQCNRSHLVLSQGQVGFFWNGGLLFLNGPTPSPVSFCGEEYAVCLRTGVPFFISILLNPHFHHWGTPQSSPINGQRERECWSAGGHQGFPVAPS